jgi:uncharacterized protein (TIGR00725 family)
MAAALGGHARTRSPQDPRWNASRLSQLEGRAGSARGWIRKGTFVLKKNIRIPQVAVIGSSEANGHVLEIAEQAGRVVAKLGAALVTGGRGGIMEAASKGCAEAGGVVIAVSPHKYMDEVNDYSHYHIPTAMGWARNAITGIAGDIVLVIGGAAGTLSEIAYAWMYDRPILAMSCCEGWSQRIAGQAVDHRREDVVVGCRTIAELEAALKEQLDKLSKDLSKRRARHAEIR